ncbi:MAG: hypothetical protein IK117_02340 [Bacteroidales bacterium]|nr:hypothetical protein [Bacteroidales bacterium]
MEEETATPYPLRTEIECDLASEPASEYRKTIVYQGVMIVKALQNKKRRLESPFLPHLP